MISVNELLEVVTTTVPPPKVCPLVYEIPSTGLADKVLELLLTTKYALGVGLANVKLPETVVGVDVKDNPLGCEAGSRHGGLLLLPVHTMSSMATRRFAVTCLISRLKFPVMFILLKVAVAAVVVGLTVPIKMLLI